MGVTGLLLAGMTAAWLRRPVEPPAPAPEPQAPTALTQGPRPAPMTPPSTIPAPTATLWRPSTPPPTVHAATAREPGPARARRQPSETRVRVVKALRGEHPTPEARRDAVLSELAVSGPSAEPWTEDARAALDTWRARVEADVLPVRAEPPRCFAAGCVSRVTFPDAASFEEAFQRTAELRLGTGGAHLQLPPERLSSGEVVASWVVLRPDTP